MPSVFLSERGHRGDADNGKESIEPAMVFQSIMDKTAFPMYIVFIGYKKGEGSIRELAHPEFSEAIKRVKIETHSNVAESAYKPITRYSHPDIYFPDFQGKIAITPTMKHYPRLPELRLPGLRLVLDRGMIRMLSIWKSVLQIVR